MRDLWVAWKVRLILALDQYCGQNCGSIRVRCGDGRITLLGRVRNTYRACRAEHVARRVRGVVEVANELESDRATRFERRTRTVVGPAPRTALVAVTDVIEEPPKNDRALAERVSAALRKRDIRAGEGGVEVCAVDSTVYLLGVAQSEAAAKVAGVVAATMPEVDVVRNKLLCAARSEDAAD